MKILVLNSGSSSQKLCVYDVCEDPPVMAPACNWSGRIEWNGNGATTVVKDFHGIVHESKGTTVSRTTAVEELLNQMWTGSARVVESPWDIDVVGHRVVHGGPHYEEPVLITTAVKEAIAAASEFAPLHNRAELDGMDIVARLLGDVTQVAVFDTGFHRKMPLPAVIYPGPYQWFEQGIRRYGFHGINHQYCAQRSAMLLQRELGTLKLVTCHLGNGCSLAAIREGRSIETTMGFTPLEGLMMGTRSGSVDPGILTYLMRQGRLQGPEIDDVLNQKSGLLGISGVSGDMRDILTATKQGHKRAKLALDIYLHRLQAGIGAMTGVLGGIDALVFTAGVGENSPEVRSKACQQLTFLGCDLDEEVNTTAKGDVDIATKHSRVRILVIKAEEDWAIARECYMLVRRSTSSLR